MQCNTFSTIFDTTQHQQSNQRLTGMQSRDRHQPPEAEENDHDHRNSWRNVYNVWCPSAKEAASSYQSSDDQHPLADSSNLPGERKSINVIRRVLNSSVSNEVKDADDRDMDNNTEEDEENSFLQATPMRNPTRSPRRRPTSSPMVDSSASMISEESPKKASERHNTELDLLLDLIEAGTPTPPYTGHLATEHFTSCPQNVRIPRCRKNGYLEKLQYTLRSLAKDNKYLEQDSGVGLIEGTAVTVTAMDIAFNVYIATVRVDDEDTMYRIALDPHLGERVYAGRRLVVFFDEEPYHLDGNSLPLFVQPQRVLLVAN